VGCVYTAAVCLFPWQRAGKDSLNVGADGATTTVCADFPPTSERPPAGLVVLYIGLIFLFVVVVEKSL